MLDSWTSCKSKSVACTLELSSGAGAYRAWCAGSASNRQTARVTANLSCFEDVNLALAIPDSDMVATGSPVYLGETDTQALTEDWDL